jgi:hypothetical protein
VPRSLARAACALVLIAVGLASTTALTACGGDDPTTAATPAGTLVTGPGVGASAPPFTPEYDRLAQRIRLLGLPPTGKEKYHLHALLRIYQDGLLVPLPENLGIDVKRKLVSAIHTHDQTGVLHFEADKPFPHTLGDVFNVWGITLGPGQLGSLRNGDGRTLRVYVNGERVTDPATHEIRRDDVIVVRFDDGSQNVPLNPDTKALDDANAGKGACGSGKNKKVKSCSLMEDAA